MQRRGFARLLPAGNLAGSLYGTVLVTSVLVTLRGSEQVGFMIAAALVTAAVFALPMRGRRPSPAPPRRARPWTGMRCSAVGHEWSIVEAALPAVAVLLLAAFDVYSVATALWIAVLLNVGLLFVWGAGMRQVGGGTAVQVLAAGTASASLGLVLVLLKVLVH